MDELKLDRGRTQRRAPKWFDLKPNTLWAESDWLDDVPLTDGHLCLSPDQVECINPFVGDPISYDDNLMRSSHHFHKAVQLVRYGRAEDYDLATALFMAALEVVSLDRRQKQHCKACGQVIHGISQRIVEIANDTIGPGLDQFFKSYYTTSIKIPP